MVIDFHTHILPTRAREDYLKRDPCFPALYSSPKAKLASVEELIASMDETGIDLSVTINIGWTSHELCQETNNYIMECLARYPGRLAGFGAISPLAGKAARKEIERCAKGGMKGVGELRSDVQGFDLGNEKVMRPIVEVLIDYGLILLTHASEPVGHNYPGKGTITPQSLYPFILRYPALKIVCAHWGGGLPFYALMPEVASAMKNVYFDSAASPFLYRPEVFRLGAELVGAEKVLFGSDYPLVSQQRVLSQLRAAEMPEEMKDKIAGGNGRRLLGVQS